MGGDKVIRESNLRRRLHLVNLVHTTFGHEASSAARMVAMMRWGMRFVNSACHASQWQSPHTAMDLPRDVRGSSACAAVLSYAAFALVFICR